MKTRIKSLYVILPVVLGAIIHFVFWYGNRFRPVQEWSSLAASSGGVAILIGMVFGFVLAMTLNDQKNKP